MSQWQQERRGNVGMMGQQAGNQERLFYSFNLEEHVPADHLLRGIDRFLDLSALRRQLAPFYSHTGRPSIDPELIVRMLLVGYCLGIRSERRLCEEVHLNLAYRWFCRLGLNDAVPDHSSFSKNRHGRFRESDAFRLVFETVVARCMAEGLVSGEGFAVDASVVKADASRVRRVSGEEFPYGNLDPESGTRAVREYLEALDEAGEMSARKSISLTDPAASWTAAPGGPAFFAYSTNYLVDVKAGIVLDVEATAAHRTQEVDAAKKMIERVEECFDVKPKHLIGDMAYGAAPLLGWLLQEKQIEPHVPVWDKSERQDGTLSRSAFTFDSENDRYTCPAGKYLHTTGRPTADGTILYRSKNLECASCELRPQCCPNTPQRKIARSVHEASRDAARTLANTASYQQSRKDRKKVEMLFAHLKRILKLDRLRLRGRSGAQDEFLLAATAQNLRRMAKWLVPKVPNLDLALA
jgi:transposase